MVTFEFKSNESNFEKERCGLKPNTVREIDLEDLRFLELIRWNQVGYNPSELKIRIQHTNELEFFDRDINDITIWKNLMIISWIHPINNKSTGKACLLS